MTVLLIGHHKEAIFIWSCPVAKRKLGPGSALEVVQTNLRCVALRRSHTTILMLSPPEFSSTLGEWDNALQVSVTDSKWLNRTSSYICLDVSHARTAV